MPLKTEFYEEIITKLGGTVDDLPDRLESTYLQRIAELSEGGGGTKVEGTLDITANGEYDVAKFAKANVAVGDFSLEGYFDGSLTDINLPNVTSIKTKAFYEDATITSISMPKVKSIGSNSFKTCRNLTLTELPSGLTSIGNYAFCYCEKMTITEIPSGVTEIGNNAFASCYGLKTITFKGTPTSIPNNIFLLCSGLTTINVPWSQDDAINVNAPWGATSAQINYNYTGE